MKHLLTVLLSVLTGTSFGQVVTGIAIDNESGEPVWISNIQIPQGTRGTLSDSTGYFALDIEGSGSIRFSHLTYWTCEIRNIPTNIDTIFLDTVPMFFKFDRKKEEERKRKLYRQKKNFPICAEMEHKEYKPEDFLIECEHGIVSYPWKKKADNFGLYLDYSEIKNCTQHLLSK